MTAEELERIAHEERARESKSNSVCMCVSQRAASPAGANRF